MVFAFSSVNTAQSGSQHKAWINRREACSGGQGEEVLRKHGSVLDKRLRPAPSTTREKLRKKETIVSIFCRQIPLRSPQGLINNVKNRQWKHERRGEMEQLCYLKRVVRAEAGFPSGTEGAAQRCLTEGVR